ncbi:MAG: transketolase, partial [Actinobacteria bacterium]|nr:transketolase [Actinomycetota bacterium]
SYIMTAITAAGSGHTGGCMSVAEIASVLYFKILNHDPKNPEWEGRDRVFWSAGHKAPVLYAVLGLSGYYDVDETVTLRKLGSPFEGHPNAHKLPGIEVSSGSLGQGLGIAVGSALSARLKGAPYFIYCLLGDGELDEGSVWEAAMSAAHYKLDNIIAVVDRNGLQIDGSTKEVMEIEPLADKWKAFGWEIFECDGHDLKNLVSTFEKAKTVNGRPAVIIARTVKGKCVSYAEGVCSYHGMAPRDGLEGTQSLGTAIKDIDCTDFTPEKLKKLLQHAKSFQADVDKKISSIVPKFKKDYFWNSRDLMKVEMKPNRAGFGEGLKEAGKDARVVALGADISDSIKISDFYMDNPERKNRWFSMGIAEQNMTTVAAGLAKEGYIPFIGSYGVFITGRNWDQLRTTVCYNNFNVKVVDAHGGISVGPDGATHQALEDISNLYYLPNMKITVPADSIEAKKATLAIKEISGPAAIRIAREATPVVTAPGTTFVLGTANIYRYMGEKKNFAEAFFCCLSSQYNNEGEVVSIIANGPVFAEALRAAYILKEEYNIEARVINMHTVKPADVDAVVSAAKDTGAVLTCEEHQAGGFGNIVAGIILRAGLSRPLKFDMMGVNDRFGQSGAPWELMHLF